MNGVVITPDERFVISNHDNNQLVVLDAATGSEVGQIPASARSPTALAVAPDARALIWATRSRPPNILVWSLQYSRPLAHFGEGEYPGLLDVSSDGQFIVSGDSQGIVRLWDADAGTVIREIAVHKDTITDLDLSPDRSMVAAATFDRIAVVALESGEIIFSFEQPSIRTVAFSPDGQRVVSGGFREEVLVWDLATGQQQTTLRAERAFSDRHILRLAFLPDPRGLVTGATDGRIRLWRLPD
jgi:WD40 repeat protein